MRLKSTGDLLEQLRQPVAIVDDAGVLGAWNTQFARHCLHPPNVGMPLTETMGLPCPSPMVEGCVDVGEHRLLCLSTLNGQDGGLWLVFLCGPGEVDWRHKLSIRVRRVVDLVRLGKTNKEIASALGITESTVKKHVSAALRAAGAKRRSQLSDTR